MRKAMLLLLFTFLLTPLIAQETEGAEAVFERIVESTDGTVDAEDMAEQYRQMAAKPVNLNDAGRDEIDRIPFLDLRQKSDLLAYLITYGEIFSLYELQTIAGFDSSLIRRIEPFVCIRPVTNTPEVTPGNLFRMARQSLLLRYGRSFPLAEGYRWPDSLKLAKPGGFYPGDPCKLYFRYQYSWFDKIHLGMAGEKDPGEQFFAGAQRAGMDFYAGYLSINRFGFLENLTIGHFRAGFGQNLTFGSGSALGSLPGFTMNTFGGGGASPGLSMSEGSSLRGITATFLTGRFRTTLFGSFIPRDGTIIESGSSPMEQPEISSLTDQGYHRTASEISKKNALKEWLAGGNVNFTATPSQQFGYRIGLTMLIYGYSLRISRSAESYKLRQFSGNMNFGTGLDYQIRFGRSYWFGEISRSKSGGLAWVGGITFSPGQGMTVSTVIRNYQPGYQNKFSNAFGRQNINANEQGVYMAINLPAGKKIDLSAFVDLFRHPWLKFSADGPSQGHEYGMLATGRTGSGVEFTGRMTLKSLQINTPSGDGALLHRLETMKTQNYSAGITWNPTSQLTFKSRIDTKLVRREKATAAAGFSIFHDIRYNSRAGAATAAVRFGIFDVPSYEARIYIYEPEVLYGFSVPAFQGKGIRLMGLLKTGWKNVLTIWFRAGMTIYSDRHQVGTDLDLTSGNIRGDCTLQTMVKF